MVIISQYVSNKSYKHLKYIQFWQLQLNKAGIKLKKIPCKFYQENKRHITNTINVKEIVTTDPGDKYLLF